jgi:hypothetical protein
VPISRGAHTTYRAHALRASRPVPGNKLLSARYPRRALDRKPPCQDELLKLSGSRFGRSSGLPLLPARSKLQYHGLKIAARVVAAGHRGWKAHRPNTQTIGIRGHNFLEVRRLDHFPNTAGSTPIWCDHEGVAAHIWLGLPISNHAQLEMVDLDVVQDWKAVIDRGPSRPVRDAGSPGRGDSAEGSIASQRPRGGSAFFSMKLRAALAADQCRWQRREPPSEGAATRSIWTRGKPMLLFAGPENGCARHHPPRTAAKFNARPRTSSSAAKLCFHDGQTMG